MELAVINDYVIAASLISRIDTKWVGLADIAGIDLAQGAIITRQTVAPLPLLTHHFYHVGVFGHVDEVSPDH